MAEPCPSCAPFGCITAAPTGRRLGNKLEHIIGTVFHDLEECMPVLEENFHVGGDLDPTLALLLVRADEP